MLGLIIIHKSVAAMEWEIKDGVRNNIEIEYMCHAYCRSISDLTSKENLNIEGIESRKWAWCYWIDRNTNKNRNTDARLELIGTAAIYRFFMALFR